MRSRLQIVSENQKKHATRWFQWRNGLLDSLQQADWVILGKVSLGSHKV
jgi:hypothetical protein